MIKMEKSILKQNKMLITVIVTLLSFSLSQAQSETVEVSGFSEVTISPYIKVDFRQAESESVIIQNTRVDREKINIEIDGKELRIFLEDAKIVSKEEEIKVNGREIDRSIYNGTEVSIIVNYITLEEVEIRSEERITFQDAINNEDFELDLYGSPKVYFESITAEDFKVAMYGESYLEVKGGDVEFQRYRCYGKSQVHAIDLLSKETKIAAYGNNHLIVNVSEKLKVSAFGEATIQYKGNAVVKSGLKIGETVIRKID